MIFTHTQKEEKNRKIIIQAIYYFLNLYTALYKLFLIIY